MDKSNCCVSDQDANNSCCESSSNQGINLKKKMGTVLMGLALVLAVSTAFKNANEGTVEYMPPISIDDFKWLKTTKKVAYVLVKGADDNANKLMTDLGRSVVKELKETDESADFITLETTNPNSSDFIEKIGVKSKPTIVVLGRGGTVSLLSESVSTIRLFKAYVAATTPISSCQPSNCSSTKSCTSTKKSTCCSKK